MENVGAELAGPTALVPSQFSTNNCWRAAVPARVKPAGITLMERSLARTTRQASVSSHVKQNLLIPKRMGKSG